MRTRACRDCGKEATEVIHAAVGVRRGWFCASCYGFTKAIGRERLLDSGLIDAKKLNGSKP